jgi:hypothetical protein
LGLGDARIGDTIGASPTTPPITTSHRRFETVIVPRHRRDKGAAGRTAQLAEQDP